MTFCWKATGTPIQSGLSNMKIIISHIWWSKSREDFLASWLIGLKGLSGNPYSSISALQSLVWVQLVQASHTEKAFFLWLTKGRKLPTIPHPHHITSQNWLVHSSDWITVIGLITGSYWGLHMSYLEVCVCWGGGSF